VRTILDIWLAVDPEELTEGERERLRQVFEEAEERFREAHPLTALIRQ
jgi:hypothetical protein